LCGHLATLVPERSTGMEKKVLSTLWLLGNKESFRGVADRFGFGKSTLHEHLISVVTAIIAKHKQFIKWPSTVAESREIADGFFARCGFPGVVGAIDGTHIPIPGPSSHRESYINRKGYPTPSCLRQ